MCTVCMYLMYFVHVPHVPCDGYVHKQQQQQHLLMRIFRVSRYCIPHHRCSNPSPGYNRTDTSCSDIDIPVLFIIIILIEACGTHLLQQKILKNKIQHQITVFFTVCCIAVAHSVSDRTCHSALSNCMNVLCV